MEHVEATLYFFQEGRCRRLLIPGCPCHPLAEKTGETGLKARIAMVAYIDVMYELRRQLLARAKQHTMVKLFGVPPPPPPLP